MPAPDGVIAPVGAALVAASTDAHTLPDAATTPTAVAAQNRSRLRTRKSIERSSRFIRTPRQENASDGSSMSTQRRRYFMVRPLLRESFGPKDLADLDGVAFLRRATLRPLHYFFFGRRFHQPITAQHFFRFDERSVGHR